MLVPKYAKKKTKKKQTGELPATVSLSDLLPVRSADFPS